MTTYRCWIAEFAKQYSNLLVQEECPIGLFLYDTPCSLLHILLEPVVPLLVERGISARLISWPEIEELLKLSEFVDEVGDDPWERQKPEWKESFGAFKQLCEIKDSKDLLVIYDFNRISNRAADIWLGSVAHYRARLNSFDRGQETTLPRPGLSHMLWIFSPLTRGEWVIEYQKIPDLLDHIFYNLWHSCIFNGQRPPSRFFYDGDQRNLPILEEDWSLPPFPEISPIQRLLRDALDVAGAEYEMEYMVHPYRLDFAIRGDKVQLDIECDGRAYHTSPEQVERDRIRNNALTEQGWIVLRYSGSQIYNKPYGCVGQILRALETHGESVRDYPLDDSGAFVPPPMADSVVEQANAAVRQKQLEDQLRLMEALEAERQAILNNPEYAEKRKLVSEMISSLAQRFSDPASLKPNV